jgi:hypothetical protein
VPWNFDNSIPIYLQIIQEMKRRIIRKELTPGERLASVRDLAKEAGVNPNTILNFGVQKYRTTDITSFNVISAVLFCTLILNSSSDPV